MKFFIQSINTNEVIGVNEEEEDITTVALFLEYYEYNLEYCLSKNMLDNTTKTRIVVEIAFGMSHVHKLGMIHRDLKINNIMLNKNYETKIIDFGLVHVSEILNGESFVSLTKGIGTLSYMSPEMINEEDYDNKTDVYSFGVCLYVIFTGSLPKQKLNEKLNKKVPLPSPSTSISKFCIELIRRCMEIKPKNRPSFHEILELMKRNDFLLAPDVDKDLIHMRYEDLNQFR